MSKTFEAMTRWPYHPRGKDVFVTNFDELRFEVDGERLKTEDVITVAPDLGQVVLFVRDEDGEPIVDSRNIPEMRVVQGEVEVIGTPKSCGCGMAQFRVPDWYDKKLLKQ